ncbi:unnamed protein product [Cyprideis torosa]|uniref:Uncharacterized protein n=1 Tax=Cyprideis torosa TaxID=163714 RepID=A0A7R8ZK12_9CRUS|nr:unnamed protein product [Cyprideis torosa]CAG0879327.1 unnamed protein product [Cyprideis torosa]
MKRKSYRSDTGGGRRTESQPPDLKRGYNKSGKWSGWSPFHVFSGTSRPERRKAEGTDEGERFAVHLRGKDLGLNICGSAKDGIFVKDVLHRGPAFESGRIRAGDRIASVTVSFENMVYEDALTILHYAHDVVLDLERRSEPQSEPAAEPLKRAASAGKSNDLAAEKLAHSFNRSQSIDGARRVPTEHATSKPDELDEKPTIKDSKLEAKGDGVDASSKERQYVPPPEASLVKQSVHLVQKDLEPPRETAVDIERPSSKTPETIRVEKFGVKVLPELAGVQKTEDVDVESGEGKFRELPVDVPAEAQLKISQENEKKPVDAGKREKEKTSPIDKKSKFSLKGLKIPKFPQSGGKEIYENDKYTSVEIGKVDLRVPEEESLNSGREGSGSVEGSRSGRLGSVSDDENLEKIEVHPSADEDEHVGHGDDKKGGLGEAIKGFKEKFHHGVQKLWKKDDTSSSDDEEAGHTEGKDRRKKLNLSESKQDDSSDTDGPVAVENESEIKKKSEVPPSEKEMSTTFVEKRQSSFSDPAALEAYLPSPSSEGNATDDLKQPSPDPIPIETSVVIKDGPVLDLEPEVFPKAKEDDIDSVGEVVEKADAKRKIVLPDLTKVAENPSSRQAEEKGVKEKEKKEENSSSSSSSSESSGSESDTPEGMTTSTPVKPRGKKRKGKKPKSSSTGDLSKIEEDQDDELPLERAVSMDFHGSPKDRKGRKGFPEVSTSSELATISDEQPELKHASVWGTMEEALKEETTSHPQKIKVEVGEDDNVSSISIGDSSPPVETERPITIQTSSSIAVGSADESNIQWVTVNSSDGDISQPWVTALDSTPGSVSDSQVIEVGQLESLESEPVRLTIGVLDEPCVNGVAKLNGSASPSENFAIDIPSLHVVPQPAKITIQSPPVHESWSTTTLVSETPPDDTELDTVEEEVPYESSPVSLESPVSSEGTGLPSYSHPVASRSSSSSSSSTSSSSATEEHSEKNGKHEHMDSPSPPPPPALLREDSKSRLMQIVADANEIVVPKKENHSKSNTSLNLEEEGREVFEISADELDSTMMSHRQFLLRRAEHKDHLSPSNNDLTSFNSWTYVDNDGDLPSTNLVRSIQVNNESSTTHIKVDPTAFESDISRTVIITKPHAPKGANQVTVLSSGPESPPPNLRPPE